MAEAITLVKIFLVLGLTFVIAGLVIPGSDSAWIQVQNRLALEGFPAFDNPFSPQVYRSDLHAMDKFCYADPPNNVCNANTTAPVGCTFSNAAQCLFSNDGDSSYVELSGDIGNAGFNVNMTQDTFPDNSIQSVNLAVWCRSTAQTVPFHIRFATNVIAITGFGTCPISSGRYEKVNVAFSHQVVSSPFGANNTFFVLRNSTQPGAIARFTAVATEVYYTATQAAGSCGGSIWDIGCQIGNFATTAYKIGIAIVNGISFALAVAAWSIGAVIDIFGGIIGTTSFLIVAFLAVPVIGPILILVIVGLILWFLFTFIKLAAAAVGALNPV